MPVGVCRALHDHAPGVDTFSSSDQATAGRLRGGRGELHRHRSAIREDVASPDLGGRLGGSGVAQAAVSTGRRRVVGRCGWSASMTKAWVCR